jgi:hypothetical protein
MVMVWLGSNPELFCLSHDFDEQSQASDLGNFLHSEPLKITR